ncbi:MAG: radical SAM protein [Candidatus Sabulitectum sp.]|nr:radical SAM protein [Candidatus Sabulitectum sp.]
MKLAGQIKMGMGALRCRLGAKIPLNVMVSITDHCPSRCSYCQIPSRCREDLSTEQWKDIFRQIAEAGTMRIGVWGGEPLARRDIVELCAYARELGMYVSLDSNGYMIPSRAEILDNIDHLVLSYDGPKEAHDRNREEGSWEKVTAAFEVASGKVRLWSITVLTKNNIHLLDEIMETAEKYGVMTTFQTLHHNDTLGGNTSDMMPSADEYSKAFQKLLQMKRAGAPILLSNSYLSAASRWQDYSKTRIMDRFYGTSCKAGRAYCNIDVDGTVYPCSLLIGEYDGAKNALDGGFKEAFLHLSEKELPCNACTASCYPEYNYLYSLNIPVALDWVKGVKRTDDLLRKMKRTGE